jgi:hypothetical protein
MSRIKKVHLPPSLEKLLGKDTVSILASSPLLLTKKLSEMNPDVKNLLFQGEWLFFTDSISVNSAILDADFDVPIDSGDLYLIPHVEGAGGLVDAIVDVGKKIWQSVKDAGNYIKDIFSPPEIPEFSIPSLNDAQSYMFNGSTNVKEQGGTIPIIFGVARTGSTVISFGTYPEVINAK